VAALSLKRIPIIPEWRVDGFTKDNQFYESAAQQLADCFRLFPFWSAQKESPRTDCSRFGQRKKKAREQMSTGFI
jgi:hypothetical protein